MLNTLVHNLNVVVENQLEFKHEKLPTDFYGLGGWRNFDYWRISIYGAIARKGGGY